MSIIKCDYYNKNNRPIASRGDLNIDFKHFAHAILSLNFGTSSLHSRFLKYMSYLYLIRADFRKQGNKLAANKISEDSYDGLKKNSDIYGAALTTIIARKKYKCSIIFPISLSMIPGAKGKRPDFLGIDFKHYMLFESKASITSVSGEQKKKGMKQLRAVSRVKINGKTYSPFYKKVLVCTNLRHKNISPSHQGVVCKVVDPKNENKVSVDFYLSANLMNYYRFVKWVINHGEEVCFRQHRKYTVIISKHNFLGFPIEIGMLEDLYNLIDERGNHLEEESVKDILLNLKKTRGKKEPLFSDGVFVDSPVNFDNN